METFFALLIMFTSDGQGSSGELIAFAGSSGRTYGLYETLDQCKGAVALAEEIHREIDGKKWIYATCVPVSK